MPRPVVAVCALLAVMAADLAGAWTPCTCGHDRLDCSHRNSTVLLDLESCNAPTWNLRGNDLRKLPNTVKCEVRHLDLSHAGLVGKINLEDLFLKYCFGYIEMEDLDLSFNHIKSLNTTIRYHDCRGITTLNVSNNLIEDLNATLENVICGTSLKTLKIANNRIREVPSELFFRYSQLQYLDLSGNPLQVVPEKAFEKLYSLRVLRLDETRGLSTLMSGTFSSVINLQYLYLSGNAFDSLPSGLFENLKKLKVLQLQRNSLQSLPDHLFRNLFSLRILILDDNRLEHLQDILFAGLHSLEDLSVRGNRLTAVPSLHLCGGPLQTAMFDDNRIQKASEKALRSLLRHGFRFGDLRGNSIPDEALLWIKNTSDVRIEFKEFSSSISLRVKGHGEIVL